MKSFDKRPASIFSPIASPAFTIVELLVVIVVIGILATITIVAYTGISNKASEASVIADLSNTNKQFKLFQVENSGYPTTIDCAQPNSSTNKCIKPSTGNTFGIFYSDNTTSPQTFCLTIKGSGTIKKNINQDGVIADGSCTFAFAGTLNAAVASRVQINLTWTNISGATNYEVQKDINSSFSSPATVYTGSSTSTSSAGLTQNTTYYYRVRATVDGDTSNWSASANATTESFLAPTNLASTSHTSTSINLSWSAVIGNIGAVTYTLERATNSSFTGATSISGISGTTYSNTGLTTNTDYYYRIKATDTVGDSLWSNQSPGAPLLAWTTRTFNFVYTGSVQTWTVPASTTSIIIEAWGAGANLSTYGQGGYSKGTLSVAPNQILKIYVGGQGGDDIGGWNGGGNAAGFDIYDEMTYEYVGHQPFGGGGGASDVRLSGGTLADRVIVAGGAGGRAYNSTTFALRSGGFGGGASGGEGYINGPNGGDGGTQASGNALGQGGAGAGGGGGGGYYGGYAGGFESGAGGGSGYVGGVTSTTLTAGNASMPAPGGGTETGHSGNGYVRITY